MSEKRKMGVFYVMFLVFVAGAVSSHGRTESEGTVFNTTQPHERMNNATVSSSLVPYTFSLLAMQWPRSFCNSKNGPCYEQNVPPSFTVHGLWPQSGPSRSIDCTARGSLGRHHLISIRQLDQTLVHDLSSIWPDLTTIADNYPCFWVSEYNKHGSCTYGDPNQYFRDTLTMARYLESRLPLLFQNPGRLLFNQLHRPDDIRDHVRRVTNFIPWLSCTKVGNGDVLLEIRFCVNRHRLTNCVLRTGCNNVMVYLPQP